LPIALDRLLPFLVTHTLKMPDALTGFSVQAKLAVGKQIVA
jgi:hypothetical protein